MSVGSRLGGGNFGSVYRVRDAAVGAGRAGIGLRALSSSVEADAMLASALFGVSEGGPMSIICAATWPERITALVLYGTYSHADMPPEDPQDQLERLLRFTDLDVVLGPVEKTVAKQEGGSHADEIEGGRLSRAIRSSLPSRSSPSAAHAGARIDRLEPAFHRSVERDIASGDECAAPDRKRFLDRPSLLPRLRIPGGEFAAMSAGASEIHLPGPQLHYDARYYAAQVRDPDGYRVELIQRSGT